MNEKNIRQEPIFTSLNEMKSLRVMFWSRIAMYEGGFGIQYRAAQKFFTPSQGEDSNKQWQRYYFGKPIKPNHNSIAKVTKHFPGTEKWFYMPLWEMFVKNINNENKLLDLAYKIKDPVILNKILYEYDLDIGYKIKTKNLGHTINYLITRGDAESLSGLSILLLNFEIRKCSRYKKKILKGITKILLMKSFVFPIGNCFPTLFQMFVDRFCYQWSSQEPEWELCDDSWIIDKKKLFVMVLSFDSLLITNWNSIETENLNSFQIDLWLRTISVSSKLHIVLAIFMSLNIVDKTELMVADYFSNVDIEILETRQNQNKLFNLIVDMLMPTE